MTKFKIKAILHLGNNSKVFESEYKQNKVVIKKYFKVKTEEFIREKNTLKSIDHCNIIQPCFIGKRTTFGFNFISKNLDFAIIQNLIDPHQYKVIFLEIISALTYLHSKSIIHFDLKPSNILYKDGHIKLIDFGSIKYNGEEIKTFDHTSAYCSLEYLLGYNIADPAKDIWSFGCIIYEVLSGKQLLPGDSSLCIIAQILKLFGSPQNYDNLKLKHLKVMNINGHPGTDFNLIFEDIEKKYQKILKKIFELHPHERITGTEAYEIISQI